MIIYTDSSALMKRVIAEAETPALRALLSTHAAADDLLVASTLAWIEVSRALRRCDLGAADAAAQDVLTQDALAGIAELPMNADVVSRARRVGGSGLRSLDAIHLASALIVGADVLVTYDLCLAAEAENVGLIGLAPAA